MTIFIVTAQFVTSVEPVSLQNIYWTLIIENLPVNILRLKCNFPLFVFQRCDIHKEQLASTRENGKTLSNQPVRFESNHSSGTGARFVSHREQVALDARTKELAIGQALKIQGYIRSDRKIVEKLNYHTQKKFVRHEDEARHVPKYCQDLCSSKSFLQKQYDTDMESTRAPSAMNQMPKHQSFNIPNTMECAGASLCMNLPIKQSFGTSKEHEIFDWPTKQRPICKPLNLENRRSGWDCSKKISAGKQNCYNHKEHLPFVGGTGDMPCSKAVNSPNGLERDVNSNNLVENGSRLMPLLPEVLLSCHNINSQEMPVANGQPLETIEFGSLGPFALKSNRTTNTQTGITDVPPLVLRRYRAATTENR